MIAAILLTLAVQDPADALVEKLRSESIEEREEAARQLKELAHDAVPALRRKVDDPDGEVARRVRDLLEGLFSPALREAVPGLEEKLAGGDAAWTAIFLQVQGPLVDSKDLGILVVPALRGAKDAAEKASVLSYVESRGVRHAAPEVLRLLKNPEPAVREAALRALGGMEDPVHLAEAVKLLGDPDSAVRRAALSVLADLGEPALPLAAARLRGEEAELRVQFDIGSLRSGIEAMVENLSSDRVAERRAAVWVLSALGARKVAPRVREALPRQPAAGRAASARLLGQLGDPESTGALESLLADKDPYVRAAAAEALGEAGAKDSAPKIAALLKDEKPFLRGTAAKALASLDAKADVLPLLDDPSPFVRGAALEALEPGSEALRKALKDPEPYVRGKAARSLAGAGAALVESPDAFVAACALESLSEKERSAAAVRLLGHPNPILREAAARFAESGLVPLLKDEAPEVRAAAARALGRRGEASVVKELTPLLNGQPWPVPAGAAEALARLGSREGVPVLLERGPLGPLNALREAAVWRRLLEKPAPAGRFGTRREALEALAGEAGLAVELGKPVPEDVEAWLDRKPERAGGTALAALEALFQGSPAEFVLESDRIRVFSVRRALLFWRIWWDKEK